MIRIRVPATSANLGPGFDCLGLALDIWNEISFEAADKLSYHASGEGAEKLNKGTRNLLTKAYAYLYGLCGRKMGGVSIRADNKIFMSSGLGSSAAAIIAGLYGANEMLGTPLNKDELLKYATEIEGHPDNVGPAIFGGLVVSVSSGEEIIIQRYEIPDISIVVVKPDVEWPTKMARAVLPKSVSRSDAIFNIGRTVLVVDALRKGDLDRLQKVMDDRIHQSYRLKHITGGMNAYKVAKTFGAAALSGAGPSIIALTKSDNAESARMGIENAFRERGADAKSIITKPSMVGAETKSGM